MGGHHSGDQVRVRLSERQTGRHREAERDRERERGRKRGRRIKKK